MTARRSHPAGGHAVQRRAACLVRLAFAPRSVVPPAGLPPVVVAVVLAAATAPRVSMLVAGVLIVGTFIAGVMVVALNDLADEAVDTAADRYIAHVAGGSRILQDGLVTRHELKIWLVSLVATGAVCLAVIVWYVPWPVLPLLALEFALTMGYSAGPRLVSTGMGEVSVAPACGIIPMGIVYLAVSATLAWPVLLVGAVPSALAAVVLVSAHVLDRDTDAAAGKRTLAVRLAPRWHTPFEITALAGGAIAIGAASAVGFVPLGAAVVTCAVLAWCLRVVWRADHAAIVRTATTAILAVCVAVGVASAAQARGMPSLAGVALSVVATAAAWRMWEALQRRLFPTSESGAVSRQLVQGRSQELSRSAGGGPPPGDRVGTTATNP